MSISGRTCYFDEKLSCRKSSIFILWLSYSIFLVVITIFSVSIEVKELGESLKGSGPPSPMVKAKAGDFHLREYFLGW